MLSWALLATLFYLFTLRSPVLLMRAVYGNVCLTYLCTLQPKSKPHHYLFFTTSLCQERLNHYEKVPLEQTTEMNEWEHQYSENISGHQANLQKDLDFIPSHNHFLLHSFVKLLYLYGFYSSDFLFVSLLILKHIGIMLLSWFLWPFLDELICFLYVLVWNPLAQGL